VFILTFIGHAAGLADPSCRYITREGKEC